jgi:hypothetical protein
MANMVDHSLRAIERRRGLATMSGGSTVFMGRRRQSKVLHSLPPSPNDTEMFPRDGRRSKAQWWNFGAVVVPLTVVAISSFVAHRQSPTSLGDGGEADAPEAHDGEVLLVDERREG